MAVDPIEHIVAQESAQFEENKRFNTEREIMDSLAPRKWCELKQSFGETAAQITRASRTFEFECEEPDTDTFHVNRIVRGIAIQAITFTFDRHLPAIYFD